MYGMKKNGMKNGMKKNGMKKKHKGFSKLPEAVQRKINKKLAKKV
jgi:protoporphyrinogen oxidase